MKVFHECESCLSVFDEESKIERCDSCGCDVCDDCKTLCAGCESSFCDDCLEDGFCSTCLESEGDDVSLPKSGEDDDE